MKKLVIIFTIFNLDINYYNLMTSFIVIADIKAIKFNFNYCNYFINNFVNFKMMVFH